jgi:hypothetical protein
MEYLSEEMEMKRILVLCACLLATASIGAQTRESAYAKAKLSAEEIKKVDAIYQKLKSDDQKLAADLKVAEATVQRLLVEAQPDMAKVEKELKAGYDIQLKMRLARIRAEVDVRAAVGDAKWVVLRKYMREANAKAVAKKALSLKAEKEGKAPKAAKGAKARGSE